MVIDEYCMAMDRQQNRPVLLRELPDDAYRAQLLPQPTGAYPYRLDIREILGDATWYLRERMSFHMVGDTGSPRHSAFQSRVAGALARQVDERAGVSEKPAFLFHLGDLVYNYGEAKDYPQQFFGLYEDYPAPIFAIAGNHDADVNPDSSFVYESLDAFMDVFCDTYRRKVSFSDGSNRLSMVQPNVYWVLETPLARFISLYSNVTKHGTVDEAQYQWLVEELRYADTLRSEQALIICVHHPPYSADSNHGSSPAMLELLDRAFTESRVMPDLVVSGHAHNYQRFTRTFADGTRVPFLVAGAGGYADLHRLATPGDPRLVTVDPSLYDVQLESHCDDRYGFLRIELEKEGDELTLTGEYHTMASPAAMVGMQDTKLFERFVVPINQPAYSMF